jgi:DNA-binding response OmpR family regulator
MAELLVVEDDTDAGDALAEALRFEGHEVRLAFDGEQGFRFLEERRPDAILLDVEMPILDGPALVNRMSRHPHLAAVPVVLISGSPELRRLAERVGTPYFLPKPYRYEQLLRILERVLRERIPVCWSAR